MPPTAFLLSGVYLVSNNTYPTDLPKISVRVKYSLTPLLITNAEALIVDCPINFAPTTSSSLHSTLISSLGDPMRKENS